MPGTEPREPAPLDPDGEYALTYDTLQDRFRGGLLADTATDLTDGLTSVSVLAGGLSTDNPLEPYPDARIYVIARTGLNDRSSTYEVELRCPGRGLGFNLSYSPDKGEAVPPVDGDRAEGDEAVRRVLDHPDIIFDKGSAELVLAGYLQQERARQQRTRRRLGGTALGDDATPE